jgi:guanylate kinase
MEIHSLCRLFSFVFGNCRGSETAEQIDLRLKNAMDEMTQSSEPNLFDKIIVNDDIKLATNALFRFTRDQ